jgi:hypothetical protein
MSTLPDLSGVSQEAKALSELMQLVLDKLENVYDSYSMPLPARRYWTFGTPSVDCEQVVVSFNQLYLGPPGDEATEPRRCRDPRTAVLNISVSRPVPVVGPSGAPPTANAIIEGSLAAAYDAWILMENAAQLDTWETSGFGLGVIATVSAIQPEGGFQTVVLTLTLAVP